MAKPETKLKLIYFNAPGRAEPIRYLFAAAEMVYEDCRVQGEEWQAIKPNTPYGALPALEVRTGKNCTMIGQSLAIGRFVARLTGLYGKTDIEAALIDGIVDTIAGMGEECVPIMYIKDDQVEKDKKIKECVEKHKVTLSKLEKCVSVHPQKGAHFVGDKLSWADIFFFAVMETLDRIGIKDFLVNSEKLRKIFEGVGRHPGIVKYKQKQQMTSS